MPGAFEIRYTKSNQGGSLPGHWDIYLAGQQESIITVWDSLELAEACVRTLEAYPAYRKPEIDLAKQIIQETQDGTLG